MPAQFEPAPHRQKYNFYTLGLPPREKFLLKSLMRLLDHRTRYQWVYSATQTDVWVVVEGVTPPSAALLERPSYKLLVLGETTKQHAYSLPLPFNAQNIAQIFDAMGDALAPSAPPVVAARPQPAVIESFQLNRWPSAPMLRTPERVRMATMMLGTPLTLADLVKLSRVAQAVCEKFLEDLMASGFVEVTRTKRQIDKPALQTTAPRVPSAPQTEQLSLFARIRKRLSQPLLSLKQ
jgi:hypothetical protein